MRVTLSVCTENSDADVVVMRPPRRAADEVIE
jgi:hypothetical protein